ncbi:aldehyde dehydrogenase family protein [Tengunoibacter tsumagoiensis]|uniref:Aldehyde dehydrogenase domain-containing protein n=1 Tax=Tengunoibacter tsumagoiensis TaxID=2014871 RepID=A0A402A9J0_9CHLR|nr:aldehyde dehydrogenase family protein [Tengunoibacter tsumagoiensis]GCE15621.1 hypothetical protein KTT_54800 [Tengunoibacter tsumagoiensis]
MAHIPIIRPGGIYTSRDREMLFTLQGEPFSELSQTPPLLLTRIINELMAAPTQPLEERIAAIKRAGRIFAEETVAGESPEEYCRNCVQVSGLPLSIMQRSLAEMASFMQAIESEVQAQKPHGAIHAPKNIAEVDIAALWVPRGKTLAVVAPGNHPMTHVSWIQALAFGYHVAVRPGRREPFTPLRLIQSLLLAGLHPGHLAYLPCSHRSVESMIEAADLAIVYGNESTVERYQGQRDVLVRGPGHSKILVEQDLLPSHLLQTLVEAIAADGGVRCTNASTLLLHERRKGIALELARRLADLPLLPTTHPHACLPVMPVEQARKIRAFIDQVGADAQDLTASFTTNPPIVEFDDGTAVLRPAVLQCTSNKHPSFGAELPFPCIWVAPWHVEEGLEPLRHSLTLTLLTERETLIQEALLDQSIRRVCWGMGSSFSTIPGLPHDGYVGQFLMEVKTLIHFKGNV